jgi:hypothetical protein
MLTRERHDRQSICAYENTYIGMSDFCGLFTAEEWAGFENTLDIECKFPGTVIILRG